MQFSRFGGAVSTIALVFSAPVVAGEEVQYGTPPAWVAPVDIETAIETGEDVVLYDRQVRLDGGVVTRYTDVAYDISNTQALQRYGTLQFSWLPDKGDLTMHRLELIRGEEVIDLLAQGVEPEVIRRERKLEKRSVDGRLTAVVAVPGMAVGDVLRMTTSTTLRDQALQDEMQATEGFVAEPTKLGFGRMRISWPEDSDVSWGTMGDIDTPEVETRNGDQMIEIALPIDKPEDMPEDAPARFRVSPTIQFGTFDSWADVSRVMAPHFLVEGAIAPEGEIAAQIDRIMAETDEPLERAALALRVVQDEISYLANGLNGGNYLPQSPEETWELRFGDCKAKSLLLLAMLRAMGIESEVVLVDIDFGDAVSVSQPIPGAFDHMIVHARIEGEDYWLDGTDAGGRLATIYEVPDFVWALPLRAEGAGLQRMEQRWPEIPDRTYKITYDLRPGVDLPAMYTIEMEARGSIGAHLRPIAVETDPMKLLGHGYDYFESLIDGVLYDVEYSYDEQSGVARAKAKGIIFESFSVERDTATLITDSATTNWSFTSDRARSAWRDIPVQIVGPYGVEQSVTYILPDGGEGAHIEGVQDLDTFAAGTKFLRNSELDGEEFRIIDSTAKIPAEIAPEDIRAGKTAIRRIASGDPKIKITEPTRFWEISDAEMVERMTPFFSAADRLVDVLDDQAGMYLFRAYLDIYARQYEASLEYLDKSIELGASADAFSLRASVYEYLGRMDEALADAERAFDLQGDVDTASTLAKFLADSGRGNEALDLLDSLGLSGDDAVNAMVSWSELSGYAGREEEAWFRLQDLAIDRPDDVTILNSKCWLAGIWSYNVEEAKPICDEAVTLSGQSASVIDSRALLNYRLGDLDAAMEDIDLALTKEPGIAGTRYLRGLIRLDRGDSKGREDILHATRISPEIERRYEAYGLKAK